ncbi:MAG: glucosidase [Planctomycetota bacterium]|nr:glucosidase [Planctomycetota bacterium]
MTDKKCAEEHRLQQDARRLENWKRWGPYLSERQWGTVREDYSENGDSWSYFPHDHARSRAYRWGEDGLLGWTDRQCRLCFSPALWNGQDAILKERLFGLAGPEGNHGEDVKECYYYLDSSPTHSYARALYKYPQREFPYSRLLQENRERNRLQPEFELPETGIFDENRYFDIQVEYAKNTPDDILIRINIANRAEEAAPIWLVPLLWYRNVWSWGSRHESATVRPSAHWQPDGQVPAGVTFLSHQTLGDFLFASDPGNAGFQRWMFTENETNGQIHPGLNPRGKYFKDAFHQYLVHGREDSLNPQREGTRCSPLHHTRIDAGSNIVMQVRLCPHQQRPKDLFGPSFDEIFTRRIGEYREHFHRSVPGGMTDEENNIDRQSYASLLWTKQFYHYGVEDWQQGDPGGPDVPARRIEVRNQDWKHGYFRDVLSMPDKWEYPWFAAWDLAFHMIPFAKIDPDFARQQLVLFLREWYMHPNGQLPAYEWGLGDVNPPVHAWACWRVHEMTRDSATADPSFLARTFQKLLMNFTWWVNRKDVRGNHVFSGGFLGLDNIGIFDRSKPLPTGGHMEQADGTAWMAFYCSSMLSMAMELAPNRPEYGDMASRFFEHYVSIAEAMNTVDGRGLWDEEDGFYYDYLYNQGKVIPMKIRSLVGLLPLITVQVLHDQRIEKLPGFHKRMRWYLDRNRDISRRMSYLEQETDQTSGKRLLAVPSVSRLRRILARMLDENEFLSPFGIRSLSKIHQEEPFLFDVDGKQYRVAYVPGDSDSPMFGGNSNWRGPIWFPMNYLIIESLHRYHDFFGDRFRIECPTGSGNLMNLAEVAREIQNRLLAIFLCDGKGRPCHQYDDRYHRDPHWKDLLLFHEYFHGDSGAGLGASHQTGWTALVSTLLEMKYDST